VNAKEALLGSFLSVIVLAYPVSAKTTTADNWQVADLKQIAADLQPTTLTPQ
jgi:hypothetical protein